MKWRTPWGWVARATDRSTLADPWADTAQRAPVAGTFWSSCSRYFERKWRRACKSPPAGRCTCGAAPNLTGIRAICLAIGQF